MTKQQMTVWQRESVAQAMQELINERNQEFARLMRVRRAAGEVH